MNAALLASGRMDWETPDEVLELVRRVGPIDLDPCTTAANPTEAFYFHTPADDGLEKSWLWSGGLIYVNPPYGRELPQWVKKAATEAVFGAEIILLVPARTDTQWWHNHMTSADSLAFWEGRLRFKGAPSSAPFPSVLAYWGPRPGVFKSAFSGRCWTVVP